jgi:hypothetical protein
MRRPSNRGKHEEVSLKKTLEVTNDATMEEEQEKKEESSSEVAEEEEEENMELDDFRYAKNQEQMKASEKQRKEEEVGLEKVAEDDNLSFLGEETLEEQSQKQEEKESDDQSAFSEEYEWDDSQLDMGARVIEGTKTENEEKEESRDTKVDEAIISKLGAWNEGKDSRLEKEMKEDKETVTKMNPYSRNTRKEGAKTIMAGEATKWQESEPDTPIKSNKTKAGKTKQNEHESKEAKLEIDSEDESTTTIQQSNTKPSLMQTSPKRDFRHASEGIQLPVFRGTLPRKYLFRYDLKIQVPASDDPVSALIQTAKAFWALMMDTDNTAALAPWAEEHQQDNPLLLGLNRFPMTLSVLKKYFARAQPNTKGQTLYVSILMAHNQPFEEIMENIRWWLSERKAGLWKRQVQAETVKSVGYLLYST